MKNYLQIGGLVLFIAAIGIGIAIWQPWKINSRTIQTVGEGKVKDTPDVAKIYGSIEIKKATADEAKTAALTTITSIIDAVKATGVADKDIVTDNVSTYPNTQYNNGATTTDGYYGRASITITVREIAKGASIVDLVTKNGGTGVSGPNLTFSDEKYEILKAEAQKAAVESAHKKADLLAETGGAKIGKVISIVEEGYSPNQPIYAKDLVSSSAEGTSTTNPIQAGESEVTANVSVTFGLR